MISEFRMHAYLCACWGNLCCFVLIHLARQDYSKEDLTFLQVCHCNLWLPMLSESKSNLGRIATFRRLLVSEFTILFVAQQYIQIDKSEGTQW